MTFSSLLGLNLLFFCAFLFGTGGDKKLEKRYVGRRHSSQLCFPSLFLSAFSCRPSVRVTDCLAYLEVSFISLSLVLTPSHSLTDYSFRYTETHRLLSSLHPSSCCFRYTDLLNAKSTIELQLADAERRQKELESQVSQGGQKARQGAEKDAAAARLELDKAWREASGHQRAAAEAKSQCDHLQSELAKAQQKHATETRDLRARLQAVEAEREALQSRVAASAAEAQSAKAEVGHGNTKKKDVEM